jgi:hypothetical protein
MKLAELIATLELEDPDRKLPIGFANPHSYRGFDQDLAFEPVANITVGEMLVAARGAVGYTFEGWEGGEFRMVSFTECWLAVQGHGEGEPIGPVLLRLMLLSDQLVLTAGSAAQLAALTQPKWGSDHGWD